MAFVTSAKHFRTRNHRLQISRPYRRPQQQRQPVDEEIPASMQQADHPQVAGSVEQHVKVEPDRENGQENQQVRWVIDTYPKMIIVQLKAQVLTFQHREFLYHEIPPLSGGLSWYTIGA
ncbi:MAG: hypothetical protein ACRD36_03845 [Candidatus Acidiferrum sp.]